MEQYQIQKPDCIKKRKRIGCGNSSGHGKTSCGGHKGQKARSGASHKVGFEGGQMPLQRRVPKRGFNNSIFKVEYQIVNLSQLEKLSEATINPETLVQHGLIRKSYDLVKILGNGELTKKITIKADAFSKSAEEKIRKAGGDIQLREKVSAE